MPPPDTFNKPERNARPLKVATQPARKANIVRYIGFLSNFLSKAIYCHAPGYLTDLIAIKEQPRYHLRSASGLKLKYPSLKLKKTLGDRAFSSAAPNVWNSLPLHIRLVGNFERFKDRAS